MRVAEADDINQRGHAENGAAAADQPLHEADRHAGEHGERVHSRRAARTRIDLTDNGTAATFPPPCREHGGKSP